MKRFKILFFPIALILVLTFFTSCGGSESDSNSTTQQGSQASENKIQDKYIKFGAYEQDNNPENGLEELEWIVVYQEKDRALLLSRYVVDCIPFNTDLSCVTWDNSSLRSWMNSTFVDTAFFEEEAQKILSVSLKTPDNPEYDTKGGEDTVDKVFCLTEDEMSTYGLVNPDRPGYVTDYAVAKGVYAEDGISWWWLRSPSYAETDRECVGKVGTCHALQVDDKSTGVRPAMWIRLD